MDKLRLDFDFDLNSLRYWLQLRQERNGNRYVLAGDVDGNGQSRNSEWRRDVPSDVCFQSLQRNKSSGYIFGTRPRLLYRQQQHGAGLHSGKGPLSNASNTGEGVLIGVAANLVPANSTLNLLFVLGEKNGTFIEFTGSGTVANGTITGSGTCSPSTPMCQGMSATFSGNQQ